MINNKTITIVKENQFDKGWTLFHSFNFPVNRNHSYKEVIISDVVKLITFSNKIDIILAENCLSSRIINEIKWANKYIDINIIAKNENIINKYSDIQFTTTKIDNNIDFNYIGIIGKESKYYIISDGYKEVDDSIEKVYFNGLSLKGNEAFIKEADYLIIVTDSNNIEYLNLINKAKKENIKCSYFVNAKSYNKNIYDFCKKNAIDLYVSDFTVNGIILNQKNGSLCALTICKGGLPITYPIDTFTSYVGYIYKCDFYDDTINTETLKNDIYCCQNGIVIQLNIKEKIVINTNLSITTLNDFINEKFDSSIVEKHNDYSAQAQKVEYNFILIPPLLDSSYKESKIYETVKDLIEKWNKNQILDFDTIKENYYNFLNKDFGIISLLENAKIFTEKLNYQKKNCEYKNYYSSVKEMLSSFNKAKEELLNICKDMFIAIKNSDSTEKYSKLDIEIDEYKTIIKEKEELIAKGANVLQNQQRIGNLEKKIEDLLKIKNKFINESKDRNDKASLSFLDYCNDVINGTRKETTDNSLGNIVRSNDISPIAKLELFIQKYLGNLKAYIDNSCDILYKLYNNVDIPENYKVYDKNDSRYIAIEELSEYVSTNDLCERYNLSCVVRR